jgi:hypothetical protein
MMALQSVQAAGAQTVHSWLCLAQAFVLAFHDLDFPFLRGLPDYELSLMWPGLI